MQNPKSLMFGIKKKVNKKTSTKYQTFSYRWYFNVLFNRTRAWKWFIFHSCNRSQWIKTENCVSYVDYHASIFFEKLHTFPIFLLYQAKLLMEPIHQALIINRAFLRNFQGTLFKCYHNYWEEEVDSWFDFCLTVLIFETHEYTDKKVCNHDVITNNVTKPRIVPLIINNL